MPTWRSGMGGTSGTSTSLPGASSSVIKWRAMIVSPKPLGVKLDQIPVCAACELQDGPVTDRFPVSAELEHAKPAIQTFRFNDVFSWNHA